MSASMAEVLVAHAFHLIMPVDLDDPNGAWQVECNCTADPIQGSSFLDAEAAFASHQAEVLAANGYGKLEDAWDMASEHAREIGLFYDAEHKALKDANIYRNRP